MKHFLSRKHLLITPLLISIYLLLGCSETDSPSSSMYGEYSLTKAEFVGNEVSTDFLTGVLILTSNSIELYLSDNDVNVTSLQSVAHYGVSSNGRKTITAVKTGLVLEYYRSEGLMVTVIKDEDGFARLFWRLDVSY